MLRCNIEDRRMDRRQQIGRYMRLEQELIEAYTASACQPGMIERLTDELAALRHSLKRSQPQDEQSGDTSVPGMLEVDLLLD